MEKRTEANEAKEKEGGKWRLEDPVVKDSWMEKGQGKMGSGEGHAAKGSENATEGPHYGEKWLLFTCDS